MQPLRPPDGGYRSGAGEGLNTGVLVEGDGKSGLAAALKARGADALAQAALPGLDLAPTSSPPAPPRRGDRALHGRQSQARTLRKSNTYRRNADRVGRARSRKSEQVFGLPCKPQRKHLIAN